MQLTELGLKNFKRFADIEIDFGKSISVLVGPNSSGKSSIIKAILALKQTASPTNENEVLATQGEYVDLGVYRDYVFDHRVENKIVITPTLSGRDMGFPLNVLDVETFRFSITFGYDPSTEQARLLEISASDALTSKGIITITKKKTRDTFLIKVPDEAAEQLFKRMFSKESEAQKASVCRSWSAGISVRIDDRYVITSEKQTIDNDRVFSRNQFPLLIARNIIEDVLRGLDRNFFYLGPLRRSPSRSYARTGHLISVGPAGEHTPSVLANLKARAAKERSLSPVHRVRLQQFRDWMKLLFPGRAVDAKSLNELVKLSIGRTGTHEDAISDVGFGISQILPILVQIAVMPDSSTLLIEQPELHLHPSVQTKLAEVLVLASKSGRRFIIETHSEHFVRGLQVAVSNWRANVRGKAKLDKENVNFLYVPTAPEAPTLMTLNEWGEFTEEWPKGFFDEAYRLAMLLLENKMKVLRGSATDYVGKV